MVVGGGNNGVGFNIPFSTLGGILAVIMIVTTLSTNLKGCFESKDIADLQFVQMNEHLGSIDTHLAHMDDRQTALELEAKEVVDKLAADEKVRQQRSDAAIVKKKLHVLGLD